MSKTISVTITDNDAQERARQITQVDDDADITAIRDDFAESLADDGVQNYTVTVMDLDEAARQMGTD